MAKTKRAGKPRLKKKAKKEQTIGKPLLLGLQGGYPRMNEDLAELRREMKKEDEEQDAKWAKEYGLPPLPSRRKTRDGQTR